MDNRFLKTVLGCLTIFSAITLWFTRTEWQNSLSAFALSENLVFYNIMHLSAVMFFCLGVKRDYYLAFGMGLILAFDMYHFPLTHDIVTATTLLGACFSIIYFNKGFERNIMIFLSFCAVLYFCIGYFIGSFHFLIAEIIAMTCIMVGKIRENWNT